MKIFNIRGNQLYKSLVEEMLASNDYPENFKKKYAITSLGILEWRTENEETWWWNYKR